MSSRKGSLIANHFVDRVLELMPSIFSAAALIKSNN